MKKKTNNNQKNVIPLNKFGVCHKALVIMFPDIEDLFRAAIHLFVMQNRHFMS